MYCDKVLGWDHLGLGNRVTGAGNRLDREGTTGPAVQIRDVSRVGLYITGMGKVCLISFKSK